MLSLPQKGWGQAGAASVLVVTRLDVSSTTCPSSEASPALSGASRSPPAKSWCHLGTTQGLAAKAVRGRAALGDTRELQ